ncbi:MAG: fimbrillin family protein [Bacteroidales bacterium]|nr:fimbrillin family protein [Bacteroidales bacterium]
MNNLLTQKFPTAAFVLLLVFGMSCSHEPAVESEKPEGTNVHEWEDSTINGDAVMEFTVSSTMNVVREEGTRATTQADGSGAFETGDYVAVGVTRSGESEVIKLYSVKSDKSLQYEGGDNQPFTWKSQNETVTIRAWSYGTNNNLAYTLTKPESASFSLETNQNANGYRELLYCKAASKSYSGGNITLNFYHQLTRVVINLVSETGQPLSISEVRIGDGSSAVVPTSASFSPTADNLGNWSSLGTQYGYINAKSDVAGSRYSAILIPTTYTSGKKFISVITTDSKTYSYIPTSNTTLTKGNQYNYTITVMNSRKKTTSATATRYDLTIGDILCSDGSIYAAENASYISTEDRTPIGIIAYVATSNSDPICENRRALVMALTECGEYAWGGQNVDEPNDLFPNHSDISASGAASPTTITNAQSDYRGLEKTNYLCKSGHGHTHPAASAAKNYSVNCSNVSNCTGWFLPSVGQWCAVLVNMGGQTYAEQDWRTTYDTDLTAYTNILNYLSYLGSGNYDPILAGDAYLTSSEGTPSRPVYVYVLIESGSGSHISNGTQKTASEHMHVLPFLAF